MGILFQQTADATVGSSIVEATIIGTGLGTLTLPANFFTVGRGIRISGYGFYTTKNGGPGTLRIRVKLGTTVVLDTTANSVTNNVSPARLWMIEPALITCRTTGNPGTVQGQGNVEFATTHAGSFDDDFGPNTAVVSLDTTSAHTIDVTAEWSVSDPANTMTSTNFVVEVLN